MRCLIKNTSISVISSSDNTALSYACAGQQFQVVKILLDHFKQKVDSNNLSKVDPNLKNYLLHSMARSDPRFLSYRIMLLHPLMAMVFSENELLEFQDKQKSEALTSLKKGWKEKFRALSRVTSGSGQ